MRIFYKATLIAMGLVAAQTAPALAQSEKSATRHRVHVHHLTKQPAKAPVSDEARQIDCIGRVMVNEARPTPKGLVSVGYALLMRGASGDYGRVGDFCAAAHAPGQFTKLVKGTTAQARTYATQMYHDWKNGRPSVEVALQQELRGASSFHNASVRPNWNHLKKVLTVEGHIMYKRPGDVSPYAYASS